MGTIKTKPFDLEAIKNGAKWGVINKCAPAIIYQSGLYLLQHIASTSVLNISKDCVLVWEKEEYNIYSNGDLLYLSGALTGFQIVLIQEPKLASDLSEVKVGDKVWDFKFGWGDITRIDTFSPYPLKVKFRTINGDFSYTQSGRSIGIDYINQTLFLTEIKFEIPEV